MKYACLQIFIMKFYRKKLLNDILEALLFEMFIDVHSATGLSFIIPY